jgi:hypothetical protein
MIDTWFKKDLEKIYDTRQIAVFIDESKEAAFLLDVVKGEYQLYFAENELDELKAKYEIEKHREGGSKYLIYTTTPKDKLKFAREYCETNGCVEIKYLQNYVKDKVHKHLNLNLKLDNEELISAAKVSIGKSQTYWMDLSHKGATEIFDLEKELLPFLANPTAYLTKYDANVQEIFFKKVNELIGQTYVNKPAPTLATEVVHYLLDGLANNNPNKVLFEVYKNWLDSKTHQKSFESYLKKYKLAPKADVFAIHPAHPFVEIDEGWLEELGKNISNKGYIINFTAKLNQRIANRAAQSLSIDFWVHVKQLLEFDEKNINQLASFEECVTFYVNHFYKLDKAIRSLYARFLNKKKLIEPIQLYYKNLTVLFLDKWFKYIEDYQSNQTGTIQAILDQNIQKTAIVVGDGVSYEFAQDIVARISPDYKLSKDHNYMYAGLPSETEHNMSQLYVSTGEVMAKKQDREAYLLKQNSDKNIGFVELESINELTDKDHYLICSHKDPDKLGETYQQNALKYFDDVADLYARKIEQLLRNGYQHVYLVTDHGFVLTGLLENADKIEVNFNSKVSKSERYIRSVDKQLIDTNLLIEKPLKYEDYNYCYFAKRLGPFKTPGVYGYSHGGLSPQETIIPYLKWSVATASQNALVVSILEKSNISEVTGEIYAVKLKADAVTDDLFTTERKVVLLFFADNTKINESDIITISKGEEIKKEYQFGAYSEIEVKVLDAATKEQLDKITIKKSAARDLGGLF